MEITDEKSKDGTESVKDEGKIFIPILFSAFLIYILYYVISDFYLSIISVLKFRMYSYFQNFSQKTKQHYIFMAANILYMLSIFSMLHNFASVIYFLFVWGGEGTNIFKYLKP